MNVDHGSNSRSEEEEGREEGMRTSSNEELMEEEEEVPGLTSTSDKKEKMEGILALRTMEKEAEQCHQSLRRKRRRLELPAPEEEMEEGEEREEGNLRFQQPNLTDLADAVYLASIRTLEQQMAFTRSLVLPSMIYGSG